MARWSWSFSGPNDYVKGPEMVRAEGHNEFDSFEGGFIDQEKVFA